MQVYRCSSCGKLFDDPIKQQEHTEYWGAPEWTGYYVSPCCRESFDVFDDESEEEEEDAV